VVIIGKSRKKGANPRITIIGGIFAIVSFAVGTVCTLGALFLYTIFPFRGLPVSWLLYPIPVFNTGFSIWYQAISELGIGPSAFMFNVGLMITGVLALVMFPALFRLLRGSIVAILGIVSGLITCIGIIGVGLAPMVMSPLHGLFGMIFFVSVGITVTLLSIAMLLDTPFSKAVAAFGFFFVVVDVAFLIVSNSILEWSVFFVLVAWILVVGIEMLLKRSVTEV